MVYEKNIKQKEFKQEIRDLKTKFENN